MKKVLIFDFDGVIIDSVSSKGKAFCILFDRYGLETVKKVNDYHNSNGGMPRFRKIRNIFEQILNQNVSSEKINKYCSRFSKIVVELVLNCSFIDDSDKFIQMGKNKYHQYIVSATPQVELDLITKKKKINNHFMGIYGAPIDKDKHIKNIIMNNNYVIDEILYIGDSLSDMTYSKKVGVDFIGFKSKFVNFPNNVRQINNLFELEKGLKTQ